MIAEAICGQVWANKKKSNAKLDIEMNDIPFVNWLRQKNCSEKSQEQENFEYFKKSITCESINK